MTTQSTQSTSPRSLAGWADPVLIRRRGRSLGHLVATTAIVVTLAVLEAGVLAPLMQVVLNMSDIESWGISLVIALASAVAMHVAGRIHAGVGPHRSGDRPGRVFALVGAWAMLALTLGVLRVIGMGTSTDVASVGKAAPASDPVKDAVAAGLFLVLFVISGLIAFSQGMDRNDAHAAQVLAEKELAGVRDRLVFWEAQLTRLSTELERRRTDERRVDDLAAIERELSASVLAAAQGRVRTEIGRHAGDPAVIGNASPLHPTHPARRVDSAASRQAAEPGNVT